MNIKPINGKILCKVLATEDKVGNIFLSDQAKETQIRSEVVSVPEVDNIHDLKVGDIVIAPKYRGTDLVCGKTTYRLYDIEDIVARLTNLYKD